MVAVTVILAAVIAAFVFGMGSGVQKTKVVAVTAQMVGGNCVVTYQGGQDHAAFGTTGTIVVTGDGGDRGTMEAFDPASIGDDAGPVVGSTATQAKVGVDKMHVVAVGNFADGTSQVLLDTQL